MENKDKLTVKRENLFSFSHLMGWLLIPFLIGILPVQTYAWDCEENITVTSVADDGPGTLRQALRDICPDGRINFSGDLYGQTIVLTSGELLLDKNVHIDGPGAANLAISGNDISRVFNIAPDMEVRIEDLTIQDGYGATGPPQCTLPYCNGIEKGAGIYNQGRLTLEDCVVKNNQLYMGVIGGGGLYNDGVGSEMFIIRCLIQGNEVELSSSTRGKGAGIFNYGGKTYVWDSEITDNYTGALLEGGGGVYNEDGYVLLERTLVHQNRAGFAAGIWNYNGRMEIRYTTITEHSAQGNTPNSSGTGPGITNTGGQIDIDYSTISHNASGGSGRSGGSGGGIYNSGTMRIGNSTISNNSATGGIYSLGGGIYNASEGSLDLNFCTITQNTMSSNYGAGGGIYSSGELRMSNTILAGNTLIAFDEDEFAVDAKGEITSGGYNLIGINTGITITPEAGDQIGTEDDPLDPRLEDLADHGGHTLTHALMDDSPAINAADPDSDIRTDQRGQERPREGRADIGAFESSFGPPTPEMAVESFTLIEADSDMDIGALNDQDVINLFEVGNRLSVRANTIPETVGSVVFELNGHRVQVENNPPYALAGDGSGDYFPWTPEVGVYTLKATPFSEAGGNGTAGEPLTIDFEVIDTEPACAGNKVSEFRLISALADTVLGTLEDGASFNVFDEPSISIEAITEACGTEVKSVVFTVNGSQVQTENVAPYAIAGDNGGDFHPWDVGPGVYEITATPYSESNGQGVAGTSLTIEITAQEYEGRKARPEGELGNVNVYPNPTKGNIWLNGYTDGMVAVRVLSLNGQVVLQRKLSLKGEQMIDISHLPNGMYVLEMTEGENQVIRKMVKH